MKIFINGYSNLIIIDYKENTNNGILAVNGLNNKYEIYTNSEVYIKISKCANNWIQISDKVNYILIDEGQNNQIQILKANGKNIKDKIPDNFDNWTEKELDVYIENSDNLLDKIKELDK